jgi:hypothetical protein
MQAVTTTMATTSGDATGVTLQGQQLPQYQYPGPIPMVYAVQAPPSGEASRIVNTYRKQQSMGIGITLIIIGGVAIVLNGIALGFSDGFSAISHGFYCGVMVSVIRSIPVC